MLRLVTVERASFRKCWCYTFTHGHSEYLLHTLGFISETNNISYLIYFRCFPDIVMYILNNVATVQEFNTDKKILTANIVYKAQKHG